MRHRRLPDMSRRLLLTAVLLFLMPALSAAHAAGSGWEITPFAALHLGGGFDDNTTGVSLDAGEGAAFGFIIGAPDEVESRYEFLYSFQRTDLSAGGTFGGDSLFDLDVHYFHIGGSYRYMEGKIYPFVSGGLGATHFVPRGNGAGSKTYFSLSLGVGAMVPMSESISLRLEGRGFLTILPENTTIFCVSSGGGGCAVSVQGDTFGQFLLMAGLVFAL